MGKSGWPALSVLALTAAAMPAMAQGIDAAGQPSPETTAPSTPAATPEKDWPLFPIGGRQAAERGYKVQRAFGGSAFLIHNVEDMTSDKLAVAFSLGEAPPADAKLIPLPFVTTDRMHSSTTNTQFKADLWVFPFLNLFAGIGKAKGSIGIGVDIDLDAMLPPPVCTERRPCGSVHLPFTATVDNVTGTVGAALAYGADGWFATAVAARTVAVSSKDRSDLHTTDLSARLGPRLHLNREKGIELMPYAGVNYFDLNATVGGTVQGPPPGDSGQQLYLRYQVDLSSRHPWAAINGVNLVLGEHWSAQAEFNWGKSSDRLVVSLTFRP